jgi:multiple sugar transport system ATP-binding protein
MANLSLAKIRKSYGPVDVIKGVDLEIADGEFVVFVGPSGCGKSTLLRMVAGLEDISSGTLQIGDRVVNALPPKERGVAMVFQSYALYPHKTVYNNMAFGLQVAHAPRDEIDRKVMEAARILHMEDLLERRPSQLSGGQRQRVAIGRAIVREPRVFLFDEPLSNLDAALRSHTRAEIKKLHRDLGATMIYVTHDQVEAMTLADKIVVLEAGHVRQVGAPLELYHTPQNKFVAGFIGSPRMNFIPVTAISVTTAGIIVRSPEIPDTLIPVAPGNARSGDTLSLGIRPEDIGAASQHDVTLQGRVDLVERLGHQTLLEIVTASGASISGFLAGTAMAQLDDNASFGFSSRDAHLFAEDGTAFQRRHVPEIALVGPGDRPRRAAPKPSAMPTGKSQPLSRRLLRAAGRLTARFTTRIGCTGPSATSH